jgi:hypothetical protein
MPAKKTAPKKKSLSRRDKLTPEQRAEIMEALYAGEKQASLARKYGVSTTAIYHMNVEVRAKLGDAPAKKIARRHTPIPRAEWNRFVTAIRKTTPEKEGYGKVETESGAPWDIETATLFGTKYFKRTPPPSRLISALNRAFPERTSLREPKPPKRITPESISPELRDNKRFVEYVTSEIYWRIQQKEYEDALAHYKEYVATKEAEQAAAPPAPPGDEIDDEEEIFDGTGPLPDMPEHIMRKYALKKNKGQAFTKPKRRKKTKKKKRK